MNRLKAQAHIIILLFAAILLSGKLFAVPHFEHFSTNKRAVYAFYRDGDGILWLGTSKGLMTYAQLQSLMHGSFRYDESMNNVITAIRQDNVGRLWLKTQANRYIAYNPRTNECTADVEQYLRQFGINLTYQFYCHIDSHGRLWVYKDSDLWLIDFKTRKKLHTLLPKSAGTIVNVSDNGKRAVIVARNSVYTSNLDKAMKIRLNFYAATMEPLYKSDTRVLLCPNNTLWIASNMKLMSFTPATRRWQIYAEGKPDINGIISLPNGLVSVSTTNTGLFVYTADGKFIDNIRQYAPLVDGLRNSHIETIYFDRMTASMLISYHKEGFSAFYAPAASAMQKFHIQSPANGYVTEDVITFASDNGSILAGTEDNGIYRLTPDGSITANLYRGSTATAVMRDSRGNLWTGLYHGGLVGSNGRRFFANQSPYKIIETAPDRFFVLLNGEGIWTVNPQNGNSRHIPTDNPWIMDMALYRGKIYAASPKCLYIIDAKSLKARTVDASRFKGGEFGNGNKALAIDRRGWVWLVNYKANTPVDIFDTTTGQTFCAAGLGRYAISAIEDDDDGNLWATTDKGLVKIAVTDASRHAFTLTLYNDNSPFNDRGLTNLGNGTMAAGTGDGYILFHPDRLAAATAISNSCPLILASLHVNGNDVVPGKETDGSVLAASDLPYLRTLELSHDENNVNLEFMPKGMEGNDRNTWTYRVSGLTDGYQPLVNGSITLTSLPSGTYDILLRMSDDSWSRHEFKVLTIHVARPPWLSWWAMVLYIILLAVLAAFAYSYNRRRIQSDLFRKVSNNLSLPLTLIINPMRELLDKNPNGETHNVLEKAYRNAQHLMALLEIKPSDVPVSTDSETFIANAIKAVEDNISRTDFTVDELASSLNMHRTSLYKKLQSISGKTPLQFIRSIRMKRARQLLSHGGVRISDVAFQVGYNSPKLFSRHFKEEFGTYPSEEMKK